MFVVNTSLNRNCVVKMIVEYSCRTEQFVGLSCGEADEVVDQEEDGREADAGEHHA